MKRAALMMALFMGVAPTIRAEGLNLSWDDCGNLGVFAKSFACDVNTGEDVLVASCMLPATIDSVCGFQADMDGVFGVTVPDWWRIRTPINPPDPVFCRDTLGFRLVHEPGSQSCPQMFGSIPPEGGSANPYGLRWLVIPRYTADTRRMRFGLEGFAPDHPAVSPGIEYYAFSIKLRHTQTVGPGSCAGCEEPLCLVLNTLRVYSAECVESIYLTTPLERNHVIWQSESLPTCPMSTPVRRSTWGSIRSIYR